MYYLRFRIRRSQKRPFYLNVPDDLLGHDPQSWTSNSAPMYALCQLRAFFKLVYQCPMSERLNQKSYPGRSWMIKLFMKDREQLNFPEFSVLQALKYELYFAEFNQTKDVQLQILGPRSIEQLD